MQWNLGVNRIQTQNSKFGLALDSQVLSLCGLSLILKKQYRNIPFSSLTMINLLTFASRTMPYNALQDFYKGSLGSMLPQHMALSVS